MLFYMQVVMKEITFFENMPKNTTLYLQEFFRIENSWRQYAKQTLATKKQHTSLPTILIKLSIVNVLCASK